MILAQIAQRFPLRLIQTLGKSNYVQISRKTITTTPVRSDIFNIGKRMRNEQYYKKLDKVEPTYELIYRAPCEYLTAFSKHVPAFSLITVSAIIAYKYAVGSDIIVGSQYEVGPTMSEGMELIGFFVGFYVFNICLYYATTQYPLRIYKSQKKYIAMFEGHLPFLPKQFHFRKGDLDNLPSVLPWRESIYKMKNRKVLVFSHHFKRPSDFNEMLKKQ